MGRFTGSFVQKFLLWDRASQIAFVMAILLLIPAVAVIIAGPQDLRGLSTGSAMGLVIAAQVIFMWANRHMVSEYVQAQRHFMRGEFEAAHDVLLPLYDAGKANMNEMTLLGNIYRQLGELSISEQILSEALNIRPNHYFPLYGFGRTLLVQGRYQEAATTFEQALENGASPVIGCDAGEAYFRYGQHQAAQQMLITAQAHINDEPHRTLMTTYLLYRLNAGDQPTSEMINDGLPYWEAEANRFAHTPYGVAVAEDIHLMASLN